MGQKKNVSGDEVELVNPNDASEVYSKEEEANVRRRLKDLGYM